MGGGHPWIRFPPLSCCRPLSIQKALQQLGIASIQNRPNDTPAHGGIVSPYHHASCQCRHHPFGLHSSQNQDYVGQMPALSVGKSQPRCSRPMLVQKRVSHRQIQVIEHRGLRDRVFLYECGNLLRVILMGPWPALPCPTRCSQSRTLPKSARN